MSWEAWFTFGVVALVFCGLARGWGGPDVLLLGGSVVVALAGVISPAEAFSGFSNPGMLTVGALFVVAAALRETGALDLIGERIVGGARSEISALRRLALWLTPLSSALNNTPVVAMMLPVVSDWCRRQRISPSRLLMPLSYFTVLGGTCTLVGTSTNLVIAGLMSQAVSGNDSLAGELRPISLLEPAWVALPCALIGVGYLLTLGRRLLPDRKGLLEHLGADSREYLVDLVVQSRCRLIGQTIEEAGLRHLPGLFLVEIERQGQIVSPVGPDEVLRDEDRLTFTGVVSSIVDLESIPGLAPAASEGYASRPRQRRGRRLSEAVISPTSPLVGQTIRDADFRALYNAAVIAVHRGGERLQGRVGDILLAAGDTLLLQTGAHFARAHRNNPDFVLVSSVGDWRPRRHDRSPISLALLALLLVLLLTGAAPVVLAAFLVAGLMLATRCISTSVARESVDWRTLVAIAGAFGLARALQASGAANGVAELLMAVTGQLGPIAALALVYLLTMVCSELITNNAAAALMFPVALAVASGLGVSPRPFVFAVMLSASLAFATPIGYQTNLMVYGPGGYRFTDFTRVGLPLGLLLWVVAVVLIPFVWPF